MGQIGSALVTLPGQFVGAFQRFFAKVGKYQLTPAMQPFFRDFGPNSVQVLRPGHPLMAKLLTLPIKGRAYSVIGSTSITRCDNKNQCKQISDGVVSFSSATHPWSEERLIVPSQHDSYRSTEAIDFILQRLAGPAQTP